MTDFRLINNGYLYFGLLFISVILVVIALGPGLFGMNVFESRWQHIFFEFLCHQDPNRSYSIGGVSMAVCARCLGIYAAFAVGLLVSPFLERSLVISRKARMRIVFGSIVINVIDIFANGLGIWVNTLESRLILGAIFGFSIAILITEEFFKRNTKSEDTYGTEFAA